MVQILIKSLSFQGHLLALTAKNMGKGKPFNLENNVDILPYQPRSTLKKFASLILFDRQNDNKTTTKMLRVGQTLCENINFCAQLSNFRTENTCRSRFF